MGRLALAGRPHSGDHGQVDQAATLALLEQGDLALRAPRLGGMARAEGVVIVSERFWAFAGSDGSLREGTMPSAPNSLRAIPLARGLVRLSASLSPLFRRQGVARKRERIFLLAAIVTPLALAFAPSWIGLIAGLVTTVALLGWLLRGRTLYLHGAEHRAIAALDERRLRETWHGAASPSRFSLRCADDAGRGARRAGVAAARNGFHAGRRVRPRTRTDDGALAARAERSAAGARGAPAGSRLAATHHARAAARRNTGRAHRARSGASPRAFARVAASRAGSLRSVERENSIEAHGLVREFKKGPRAVDGIDLRVEPGEIYGFLGPNGAGKSTTVHMLTTLLPPTAGTATVAGFDVVKEGPKVRKAIGAALQEAALDPFLTGREHLRLQTTMHGITGEERKRRSDELLTRVGLTEAADRKIKGYSGGMKRRLDLALALVHRPRILFLDEPTTGLDVQSRTALWVEVGRLAKEEGVTVFLTTQYLEEADVLADRVGIIDHGTIVAEGTPEKLKSEISSSTVEAVPAD